MSGSSMNEKRQTVRILSRAAFFLFCGMTVAGAADTEERLKALEEQNRLLQQQLGEQRRQIDELSRRLGETPSREEVGGRDAERGISFGNIRISGEGGVG